MVLVLHLHLKEKKCIFEISKKKKDISTEALNFIQRTGTTLRYTHHFLFLPLTLLPLYHLLAYKRILKNALCSIVSCLVWCILLEHCTKDCESQSSLKLSSWLVVWFFCYDDKDDTTDDFFSLLTTRRSSWLNPLCVSRQAT